MCSGGGRKGSATSAPMPAAVVEASGKAQIGGGDSMAKRAAAADQANIKTSTLGDTSSATTQKKTLLGQ